MCDLRVNVVPPRLRETRRVRQIRSPNRRWELDMYRRRATEYMYWRRTEIAE
jgi:hypothetical protein